MVSAMEDAALEVSNWPGAFVCVVVAICATIIIVKLFG